MQDALNSQIIHLSSGTNCQCTTGTHRPPLLSSCHWIWIQFQSYTSSAAWYSARWQHPSRYIGYHDDSDSESQRQSNITMMCPSTQVCIHHTTSEPTCHTTFCRGWNWMFATALPKSSRWYVIILQSWSTVEIIYLKVFSLSLQSQHTVNVLVCWLAAVNSSLKAWSYHSS